MPTEFLQSNFTAGELSPLMYARADFQGYYKGAKKLRNIIVLPQGGATARFGTSIISDELPSNDRTKLRMKAISDGENYFLFVFSNKLITVYKNYILQGTLESPYSEDIVRKLGITQKDNTLIIAHKSFKLRILQVAAVAVGWELVEKNFRNFPTYDFRQDYDDATFTPSATSGTKAAPLTITAALGTPFVGGHVGGLFFGNEGTLRITEFVSSTVVKGYTIETFKNTNVIEGQDAYLAETVFSAARGYASYVVFYQGRLGLANTEDLSSFIGLSATNDYYNFDDSQADDGDPIIQILTGEGSSSIRFLKHAQDLIVFTESGEFTTPPFTDKPSSPSTTYYTQQTTNGVADVEPVILDNRIIFADKGGKIIREFVYDIQRSTYQGINISLLSTHLITGPIAMSTFENPQVNDGVYLLCVNDDGTMPIYQSIDSESIKSWMSCDTDGKFRDVESVDDQVYFIVERTINESSTPVTKLYLEKIDFSVYTDCTKTFNFGSPQTVISGLEWLNEKTVEVLADGKYVGQKLIHNNTITLEEGAEEVIIGLPIDIAIIPMAVNLQSQDGNNLYRKKRIRNVYVNYHESLGVVINGVQIPNLKLDVDKYGVKTEPKSGIFELINFGGWQSNEEVLLTRQGPFPFTIRGIGFEIESV